MPVEERLTQVAIEDEMRLSYLDYAMSVIVGRALPDVRDGLKPVHRRILFGMNQMGLGHNRVYRKAAKIVGEIMGNYHPHGDSAIYDALVRMAQNFNMRYALVDGQGNYGSVDGDPPAAMRYTEARLTRLAGEMLADIDKQTVDFGSTYDESDTEPLVLPARIPNLLVNGAGGIAVGYATNIPTHNLSEVVTGLIRLLEDPHLSIEDLMQCIPGPDFPTAGFIYGTQGIRDAYHTGRGLLTVRAKTHIETDERTDRDRIIVTEIPYQVNKAKLMEKIAELIHEKRIDGISDLRDESDREGLRVVIELKKGEIPLVVVNQLYKHTQLQNTFGVIMLALVHNRPEILNLKEILTFGIRVGKPFFCSRGDLQKSRGVFEQFSIQRGFIHKGKKDSNLTMLFPEPSQETFESDEFLENGQQQGTSNVALFSFHVHFNFFNRLPGQILIERPFIFEIPLGFPLLDPEQWRLGDVHKTLVK